jgi:hypothetical protein
VNHAFDVSLRDLAHFLETRSDLDDVIAIRANMSFGPAERSATRFANRFGFERVALGSFTFFPTANPLVRRKYPDLDDGARTQRGGASG